MTKPAPSWISVFLFCMAFMLGEVGAGIRINPAIASTANLTPGLSSSVTVQEADRLLNLGSQQLSEGDAEAALHSTQAALALYQLLGDRLGVAQALGNIGTAYLILSNARQAADHLYQALELARELGDRQTEGNALGSLGQLYLSQRDYEQSVVYLEQALALAESLDNSVMIANVQQLLQEVENVRSADMTPLAEELTNQLSGSLSQIQEGNVEGLQEFFEQLRRWLPTDPQDSDMMNLYNQGFNLLLQGQAADAQAPLEAALAIAQEQGDRDAEMNILFSLGGTYQQLGQFSQAIAASQRYLDLVRSSGDVLSIGVGLFNLSQSYWGLQDFANTEATLREMMELWEFWGGWTYSGLQADSGTISNFNIVRQTMVYEMLQHVLLLRDKPEEALEIAERGRARAMINLLAQRLQSDTTFTVSPPTVAELREVAQNQRATLVQYSLIQYSTNPGEGILVTWVIQPDGAIAYHAVDLATLSQSLTELITDSRDAIGVRRRSEPGNLTLESASLTRQRQATQQQTLEALHQVLIEPIVDWLPNDPEQPVIFIPQGELFLVPFAALRDRSGQYLIEQHTILTAPSIQVLDLTDQYQQQLLTSNSLSESEILVVGNPSMPLVPNPVTAEMEQLPNLAGAEQEAEAIASLLGSTALVRGEASKSVVINRMEQSRIIHLATHGLLDYGTQQEVGIQTIPGALALAPSRNDNGLLTATEILQMDLKAELVVLSACDTGRGRITGDGVLGLSRSFIAAGVPSVIVSLWAVDDEVTSQLMVEFYQQWEQTGLEAQALRQAMLITMKKHPDPRLWAAFTLVGAAE